MSQVRIFLAILVWVGAFSACATDAEGSAQSAVARNFEVLAREVTGCADAQATCSHKAIQMKELQACQSEYTACRTRAGKSAEDALIEAISECQERANDCEPSTSAAPTQDRCEASLRACIGEASSQISSDARRDASAPSARAPTYQCFGQLRECVDSSTGPKECAAEARTCVLAAVEKPEPRRPSMLDAGMASDAMMMR